MIIENLTLADLESAVLNSDKAEKDFLHKVFRKGTSDEKKRKLLQFSEEEVELEVDKARNVYISLPEDAEAAVVREARRDFKELLFYRNRARILAPWFLLKLSQKFPVGDTDDTRVN